MKKILLSFSIILIFISTSYASWVKGYYKKNGTYVSGHYRNSNKNLISSKSYNTSNKSTYVKSYYKKSGTNVSSHYRSRPNAYKYDNYSYSSSSTNLYNKSYSKPKKNYSSSWYTPSFSDGNYTYGKSYNEIKSYKSKSFWK